MMRLLLLLCGGAQASSAASYKPVQSSWPMGLPKDYDLQKDGKSGSLAKIKCSISPDQQTQINSVGTLYMATSCPPNYTTPDGQTYTLVPMTRGDASAPLIVPTRAQSTGKSKRYERNGNILDIVNVTHRNLNETANNAWADTTNLKIRIPVVGDGISVHGWI